VGVQANYAIRGQEIQLGQVKPGGQLAMWREHQKPWLQCKQTQWFD